MSLVCSLAADPLIWRCSQEFIKKAWVSFLELLHLCNLPSTFQFPHDLFSGEKLGIHLFHSGVLFLSCAHVKAFGGKERETE